MNESLSICRRPAAGASNVSRSRPAHLRKLRLARTETTNIRGLIFDTVI